MYLSSWSRCHSVVSTSNSLRSAITASSMNTPKSVIDALDSLNLEHLSLQEPEIKPRRDYTKCRAKKCQSNAQYLDSIAHGALGGASQRGLNPQGAHDPIWSSASAPKNRTYSTVQSSPRSTFVKPDLSKLNQFADASTLASCNLATLPIIQKCVTNHEAERQNSSIKPSTEAPKKFLSRDKLHHLPAPLPTSAYLSLAFAPIRALSTPQRLLLVLDLNGSLIYRPRSSTAYDARPRLPQFLDYCFANHTVLVWSSATPRNVDGICLNMFDLEQLKKLLGVWARDTLGLSPSQYSSRVQVYKRLNRIWDNPTFALKHPEAHLGMRWCQENTLLIDDSILKASAQLYNLVQIPEFTEDSIEKERNGTNDVLGQVMAYLEEARTWDNVSSFVRERKFVFDTDWSWDWKTQKRAIQAITSDDEEDGGVKLDM